MLIGTAVVDDDHELLLIVVLRHASPKTWNAVDPPSPLLLGLICCGAMIYWFRRVIQAGTTGATAR